jgi:hypothetical protein
VLALFSLTKYDTGMPPFDVLNLGLIGSLVSRTSAKSEVRIPSRHPGLDFSADPSFA